MAFTFDPGILILDEPTAGLDPLAARHLKDRIRAERKAGKTIIVTSHVLSEVQELADNIVFLLEGSVRFSGSAAELLKLTQTDSLEGAVAELMVEGEMG
jgi:Cu-processing system ATP-binding protein